MNKETDAQENLLIKVIKTLDALGLQVVAIKDGPGPMVIKVVNKPMQVGVDC
jgi:hypothetical protein